MKIILPGKTIGIIGGGQLGRMLAMSAKEMGYKIAILDPSDDCCAKLFADVYIKSDFNDYTNVEKLCEISDVVTYEFENIDYKILEDLQNKYNIVQESEVLRIAQHRVHEKDFARSLNIPTTDYIFVEEDTNVDIDKEYLMKTVRFGYDGKGQKKINSKEQIEKYSILEELLTLDKEISVIAVKDREAIQIVGVVENEHRNGILYKSNIPSTATKEQEEQAIEYTKRILNSFNYYGVLSVEFFISDSKVIFNEMAPRVHNSGHITMQSAEKSQFRAHIEAICGLKVGNINNREATMYNILGQDLEYFIHVMQTKNSFIHLYEKEHRENRKIGHINFYGNVILGEKNDK